MKINRKESQAFRLRNNDCGVLSLWLFYEEIQPEKNEVVGVFRPVNGGKDCSCYV